MRSLYEEKLVSIPAGCSVSIKDKVFTFEGPLGKQEYDVSKLLFTFDIVGEEIRVRSWHGDRKKNALLGTIASHIRNHARGVVNGFKYVMRAAYRHFSINMAVADAGKSVTVRNFMGARETLSFAVRGETQAMIGDHKDILIVQGINLEDVAQTAALISNTCAKKKKNDCRIFLDGIFVAEKTTIKE